MHQLTADDLSVGTEIPAFERTVGFANWNRYAAVNDEFVPIHMDDDAGRAAGYDGAFGMGNLQLAYLHCMLRAWLADQGRVVRLGLQYRKPALRGSLNRARGVVARATEATGQWEVELDIWVEDEHGERLTPGTATVIVDRPADG